MSFKSDERSLQVRWKAATTLLTNDAKRPGRYTGDRDGDGGRDEMFLHEDNSAENLFPRIRRVALETFARHGISWHDGSPTGLPSNYLMDSMVSCVNCLMPFAEHPRAAAALFSSIVPEAEEALPVEDNAVIAFEWMGLENYLGEKSPKRRRGAYGTNLDAHLTLRLTSGERVGVLVEWKYTESYAPLRSYGRHYEPLLRANDGPIDLRGLSADVLFYEPFYQLSRSMLLADSMERARENGVNRVIVVLVVPERNTAFRDAITSPQLVSRGATVEDVMRGLLRKPNRFVVTSAVDLFRSFPMGQHPEIADAVNEICDRYVADR